MTSSLPGGEGFDLVMRAFPYVFHPTTVLGVGIPLLIRYEWNRQSLPRSALRRRLGAFLGSGVLAVLPSVAFVLVTGQGVMAATKGNSWQVDWLVGGGILVSAATTWYLWRRFDWGSIVPGAMEAFAIAVLPYLALSPFWNVSGHVVVALLPTLYLTLLDERFWPLVAVPLLMVPNRIYLDAHTVPQVVGGFLVGAVLLVVVFRLQAPDRWRPPSGSTPD